MRDALLRLESVSYAYPLHDVGLVEPVLREVSLEIPKGQFVALLGGNGSGKSTLAKLCNAMLIPTSGRVLVNGMDTAKTEHTYAVRQQVGLVLQNPDNQLIAGIVEEEIAFGPENLGLPPHEIRHRVAAALKAVDMEAYRNHAPHQLSGGQKQRIAIAGILAMEPTCIILDEPTAMLDPKGRQEVLATITRLHREKGITVVLITHYMEEATLADRVIGMDQGTVFLDGTPRTVFSEAEELRRHQLDVPQATALAEALRKQGVPLPKGILNPAECAAALERVLKERSG